MAICCFKTKQYRCLAALGAAAPHGWRPTREASFFPPRTCVVWPAVSALPKILLVDDSEDDYILTRDLLAESAGGRFGLDWAPSYDEGLAAIERREHAVYLL